MLSMRALPLAILAGVLTLACGAEEPARAPVKNVLLISLDTLRADRCGFMGWQRPTTPFLDELAARGVVFEQHMANSHNTLISHASLLTGLLPPYHDTYDELTPGRQKALSPSIRTLAEAFAEGGFATVALTSHPVWLGAPYGLGQGFGELRSDWSDASVIAERFVRWLGRRPPKPFFAFLHFYDAHSEIAEIRPGTRLPYEATPELEQQFAGAQPPGFTGCAKARPDACASQYLQAISNGEETIPPEHVAYVAALYEAGIAKLDAHLRALFAELERQGLLADTLVAITSDHGEEFMEHGQMLHAQPYDEIMHVPLLVVLPGGSGARRVAEMTSSIDVAPTLLELAGLPPLGQGESLAPAVLGRGKPSGTEVLFNSSAVRGRDASSRFKLIEQGERRSFHDLDADARELRDLLAPPAGVTAARLEPIVERLRHWREEGRRFQERIQAAPAPAQDQRQIDMLKRLGY